MSDVHAQRTYPDDSEERHPADTRADAGRRERLATVALGGTLLTIGLRRRSLGGTVTAVAGGWLCYKGLRGEPVTRAIDAPTDWIRRRRDVEAVEPDAGAVRRSITVGRPADELTEFWRDPDHLTAIVGSVADVTATGEDRHRWTVRGPLGRSASWETQLVEERPDERLRWESLERSSVSTDATIAFDPAPGDRGTEVTLTLRVDPPGGPIGDAAMRHLDLVPKTLAGAMLRRFKSLAETGEIPTLERNPSARGAGDLV